MKKIGILTLPLGHNYGGVLQAYALKTILEKYGAEVFLIQEKKEISVLSKIKRKIYQICHGNNNLLKQTLLLQSFINKHFKNKIFITDNSLNDYNLDAIIVGSDQVWRQWSRDWSIDFYFLSFATEWDIKRYTYAASFGIDNWLIDYSCLDSCLYLARKFDQISVREKQAVDICADVLKVSAMWHLDPTLLLNINDYKEISDNIGLHDCGLVTFILDPTPEKQKMIDKLSEAFNNKYEVANKRIRITKLKETQFCSIENWLATMMNASFIVTDSFHGTCFAINFCKPFIVISNEHRGQSRFESILGIFCLQDRLVQSISDIPLVLNTKIDWDEVNRLKRNWMQKSLDYLYKCIYD